MNVSPIIGRSGVRLNKTCSASTHPDRTIVSAFMGSLHVVDIIGCVKVSERRISFDMCS